MRQSRQLNNCGHRKTLTSWYLHQNGVSILPREGILFCKTLDNGCLTWENWLSFYDWLPPRCTEGKGFTAALWRQPSLVICSKDHGSLRKIIAMTIAPANKNSCQHLSLLMKFTWEAAWLETPQCFFLFHVTHGISCLSILALRWPCLTICNSVKNLDQLL